MDHELDRDASMCARVRFHRFLATWVMLQMLLVGCSSSALEPVAGDYKEFISRVLAKSGGFEVESVEIMSAENAGSAVEPEIRARVVFHLALAEALFARERVLGDTLVIKKTASAGTSVKITAITRAVLGVDGQWDIKFWKKPAISPEFKGKPLSQFAPDSYVVSGSNEEKELLARLEAEDLAERERIQREKAALIAMLVGTWQSENVVLNYPSVGRVNEVVRINESGRQWEDLVYEIAFSESGEPIVRMRGSENNANPVEVVATVDYQNASVFRIREMERKKIGRRASWSSGRTWELALGDDKRLTATVRERHRSWKMVLSKKS